MTISTTMSSAGDELRAGWTLVVAAAAGASLAAVGFYTMGLFVAPLQAEFGWSRGFVTSALAIYAIVSVLLSGLVGYLIDKVGPRRVALPGTALYCLTFGTLATANGSHLDWWLHWVLLAIVATLVNSTVWSAAIVSRFDAARGIALALTLTGGSVTAIFGPILADRLISNHGWRFAYTGIAGLWFVVCMPVIFLFFFGRQDKRKMRPVDYGQEPPRPRPSLAISHALRSPVLLKLGLASFLIVLTVTGTTVHLIPMLTASGVDRASAASIAGVIGLAAFVGRMTTGSLLDRLSGPGVGAVVSALPAFAFAGLIFFDGSIKRAFVIAILLGICSGAELELAAYLSSRFFGKSSFGTLFGLIVGFVILGAGVGPMLLGLVYDEFGSYEPALMAAIPLSLLAAALILSLGPYPSHSGAAESIDQCGNRK